MLFLSVFSLLSIIYFCIGWYASSQVQTNEDYFLAGRDLGFGAVTFTLVATHLGGGVLAGGAQEGFVHGYYGMLYGLGLAVGLLLLGSGFAAKLRDFNVPTTAALFETKYRSPFLKKVASFLMIVSLAFILVGQVIATRGLLFGIGVQSEWVVILFWLLMVIYTMVGGLKAVVLTDIAQVIFILFLFTSVFVYFLSLEPASFFTLGHLCSLQDSFSSENITLLGSVNMFLMPVLFNFIEQDMAQRFFAARTKRIATMAAIAAAVCIILFLAIPVYFGMKAKLLGLSVPAGANPLITVLGNLTGDIVMVLVACGVLAAITSTADSLMCAVSSNIVQDFDCKLFQGENGLKASKWVTLLTGLFALLAGYYFTNILSLFAQSYEFTVSCLFVPIFVCFYKKDNFSSYAAGGAIAMGMIGFVLFRIVPLPYLREVATLGLSGIGYIVGGVCGGSGLDKTIKNN